jgi:hypothetical protein
MNPNALSEESSKRTSGAKISCNASSAFNFSVGGVALVVAVLIGCFVYSYFTGS